MPTTNDRASYAALRAAITRLTGPQAPIILSPLDRLEFMQRHFAEIDRDVRYGMAPAPIHLVQLAAHCILWHAEERSNDGA